jgi:hypothetical protein
LKAANSITFLDGVAEMAEGYDGHNYVMFGDRWHRIVPSELSEGEVEDKDESDEQTDEEDET